MVPLDCIPTVIGKLGWGGWEISLEYENYFGGGRGGGWYRFRDVGLLARSARETGEVDGESLRNGMLFSLVSHFPLFALYRDACLDTQVCLPGS